MGLPEVLIPEDKLPQCWSDDVRMNALFAPFRIKSANPESWDMKMKFWSDLLRLWCKYRKDPVVSASDAKFAFQRKGRTPACLEIVVEEMIRNGELSPVSKYTQILHNGPDGWMKWGAKLAFKPAAFALTAAASLLPARQALDGDGLPKASIDATQRFVLESAIEEQSLHLLENYPSLEDRVGSIEQLMKRSGWSHGRDTFELLLGWLLQRGMAIRKHDVFKLAEPNKKASPITESDEALVKLMSAESRLAADFTRLEREVAACETDARAALQMGNRPMAKNHLRKKHKAQQRLDRCEAALDNVRQLLLQMKDVDTNAAIVDTYRTSSNAMKQGMKESGLSEDAVHETMDDLKEVLESYNEVSSALSGSVEDSDAAELERELRELLDTPAPTPAYRVPGARVPESTRPQPRISEREFVFDGEERMMAELAELDALDAETSEKKKKDKEDERRKEKIAVGADWKVPEKPLPKPNSQKSWYPPSNQFLKETWNNNPETREIRLDDRLHPGQPLDLDFTTPPHLFGADFQVRDYKPAAGVWIYNKDTNSNPGQPDNIGDSIDCPEDASKPSGSFQMAPGGERKASVPWAGNTPRDPPDTIDDLERRLRDLRGFL